MDPHSNAQEEILTHQIKKRTKLNNLSISNRYVPNVEKDTEASVSKERACVTLVAKLESQSMIIADKGKNISESDCCASEAHPMRLCVRNTTIEVVTLGHNHKVAPRGATTMVVLWRHNHVVITSPTYDILTLLSQTFFVVMRFLCGGRVVDGGHKLKISELLGHNHEMTPAYAKPSLRSGHAILTATIYGHGCVLE
ncbi:Uncharacterized protein Fot_29465 [Forsythia ovata]|uniref:Uncharacterized protein n=1 Tax=Forsythia ovata TaxID=205694 RepID=A0ABD1TRZ9_9LAMI